MNSFQVITETSDIRPKITDIPFEILLDICEHLDSNSLANLAKTHPNNQQAAKYVFNHKCSMEKNLFTVNGYKFVDGHRDSKNSFEFDTMLNVLEMFGQSMAGITIDYAAFDLVQSQRLNQYLSKYVIDSLVVIELMNFHDAKLNAFSGPFKRTEFVHLRFGIIDSNDIKLNEIFPAVQSLNLNQMKASYSSCFEQHFPNLVEMETESVHNKYDLAKLKRRLQLNGQLRYLIVNGGNWEFLKMISEQGTQLQYLGFQMFDGTTLIQEKESTFSFVYRLFKVNESKVDVHFKNVTDFGIYMSRTFPNSIERIPIKFDNLERIQCFESIDKWFDVIIQNGNLKNITIGQLNDQQLQQIAEKLPILQEFRMIYDFQIDDLDKVIRFIETNKHLKRVDFSIDYLDVCNAIIQRFEHKWRYEIVDEFYVFVRD